MAKELKRSAEGRKCKFLNCQRLLSIYNHQDYCHIHLEQRLAETSAKNQPIGKKGQAVALTNFD